MTSVSLKLVTCFILNLYCERQCRLKATSLGYIPIGTFISCEVLIPFWHDTLEIIKVIVSVYSFISIQYFHFFFIWSVNFNLSWYFRNNQMVCFSKHRNGCLSTCTIYSCCCLCLPMLYYKCLLDSVFKILT